MKFNPKIKVVVFEPENNAAGIKNSMKINNFDIFFLSNFRVIKDMIMEYNNKETPY